MPVVIPGNGDNSIIVPEPGRPAPDPSEVSSGFAPIELDRLRILPRSDCRNWLRSRSPNLTLSGVRPF